MATPMFRVGHRHHANEAMYELDVYVRVQGEFREMPGLILTVQQAARLFSLELSVCNRILHALVADGVLTTNGAAFARAGVVLPLA